MYSGSTFIFHTVDMSKNGMPAAQSAMTSIMLKGGALCHITIFIASASTSIKKTMQSQKNTRG